MTAELEAHIHTGHSSEDVDDDTSPGHSPTNRVNIMTERFTGELSALYAKGILTGSTGAVSRPLAVPGTWAGALTSGTSLGTVLRKC